MTSFVFKKRVHFISQQGRTLLLIPVRPISEKSGKEIFVPFYCSGMRARYIGCVLAFGSLTTTAIEH